MGTHLRGAACHVPISPRRRFLTRRRSAQTFPSALVISAPHLSARRDTAHCRRSIDAFLLARGLQLIPCTSPGMRVMKILLGLLAVCGVMSAASARPLVLQESARIANPDPTFSPYFANDVAVDGD